MIVDQNQINLLKKNALFNSVEPSYIESIIKPKNFFTANDGTLLYSSNDESLCIYLIVEGEVKIKFNGEKDIKYKYLLDFFGEKEMLDNATRISSAITNDTCILYTMNLDEINSVIADYPEVQKNLKKNIDKSSPKLVKSPSAQV